jgi:hypothetical protein
VDIPLTIEKEIWDRERLEISGILGTLCKNFRNFKNFRNLKNSKIFRNLKNFKIFRNLKNLRNFRNFGRNFRNCYTLLEFNLCRYGSSRNSWNPIGLVTLAVFFFA